MRLLDLFCGAGGAAMGYHQAGFSDIVGVDLALQRRYPFDFVQADALEYLAKHGREFDLIHASPPCQGYSSMRFLPFARKAYPLLLPPLLQVLAGIGRPYVVENVMSARLGSYVLRRLVLESHGLDAGWLCGLMFGLGFYRHRLFATNWFWLQPGHPTHRGQDVVLPMGNSDGKMLGSYLTPEGYRRVKTDWREAGRAMGIDWMTRGELTQAIPPAYTAFLGKCFLQTIGVNEIRQLSGQGVDTP